MPISDLFDSGFRQRNKDHFGAIVKLAMEDGEISDEEKDFLDRLAGNLDILDTEYKMLLKNCKDFEIHPPVSQDYRLERLYDLTKMVFADKIDHKSEVKLLTKMAIGLGFSTAGVDQVVNRALKLVAEGADLEVFISGLK